MNISAVDTSSTVTSGAVAAMQPKPQVETSPGQQASEGGAAAGQKEVKKIVEKMQEQIDSMNISLQYSTYGDRGEKIAVSVVNKETGELIREIPSKELRNLYNKMSELAGMIFNKMI